MRLRFTNLDDWRCIRGVFAPTNRALGILHSHLEASAPSGPALDSIKSFTVALRDACCFLRADRSCSDGDDVLRWEAGKPEKCQEFQVLT